ncbi:MAG: DMT family transporter [Pyrinomonadaceae bacterium]
MENRQDNSHAPYLALVLVQLAFGSFPVVGKVALAVIPAVGLVGFRIGFTAIALFIFQALRRRLWLDDKKDYLRLAGISLFGVTFNQLLFTTGLSLTTASNTSLIAVTIPIFALTAGSILGTEKLRGVKILGIVLAGIGVILLIDPRRASFSSETTIGDLLVVLNSLSYGIYVAISKEIITRNGAMRSIMWIFIFAAIVCVPLGAYSMSAVDVAAVGSTIWLAVLYVAVIGTTIPYLLNAWALARVNPSTVAVFVYMQPVIGFLLAVVFLGEHIGPTFIAAAILVFAGVFLVTKKFVPAQT